jgi:cell wall-associated NlpC family hydrolase
MTDKHPVYSDLGTGLFWSIVIRRVAAAALCVATAACASTGGATPSAFPGAGNQPSTHDAGRSANTSPTVRASSPAVSAILESARSLVGTPYRFGGASPADGFDCSGLVSYVARLHGVLMPRIVADQFAAGRAVDRGDLAPGDLIFYSTIGPGATHVGIVLETASTLRFIHAPADGSFVRVERFDTPYWESRWVGARRVF